ncbi:SLC13 family permease [Dongia rigui]|uniref:SLC13 family permease n=1 Tax=Dongia rigui TaxID=940149 RepID=A0ABU5DX10_9PROT|nr:SLC13 family permease [Dongia rigui]MDY0871474.1 SLC13 family permease [Dongia rigui]
MTTEQGLAFGIVAIMMALFVWGRPRYDITACLALMAAVGLGLVKPEDAFAGFSNDIVIIVASALVVSSAIAQTGIIEATLKRVLPSSHSFQLQLLVLVGTVTVLSAFVKNIGALAIMIPVAFQMARRSGVSPSRFLMPMSFGALLGGLTTQIGTSPNIIVSEVRADLGGTPFTMFDFTPVGVVLACVGLLFLMVGHRLLPERTRTTVSLDAAVDIKNYVTEAEIPENSPLIGRTVADLKELGDGETKIIAILGADDRHMTPLPDALLKAGQTLILEGDHEALERIVSRGKLQLESGHRQPEAAEPQGEVRSIEAVIGLNSPLIGLSAQDSQLFQRYEINLLAVSRTGQRLTDRLGTIELEVGDVVVLQGNGGQIPEKLRALNCLPLAERELYLGRPRIAWLPIAILLAAMGLTAFGILPVAIAFFGAAVAMVVARAIALRQVYQIVEWPIILMLAALIPVSEALHTTGATDLIADGLSHVATGLPPYGALGLILAAAMMVTPFLNNAATVLIMAPIAASFSHTLGYQPEAFLMAVAIGAGCDFLTPIGHQCNTLVMGPGGYRFGDYARLGGPLSLIVIVVAVPALLFFWPVS